MLEILKMEVTSGMNILFLTLIDFESVNERNLYTDLLREFIRHGHRMFVISPVERKKGIRTHLIREPGCAILKLRTGNMQKNSIPEKGISMLTIESLFLAGIKKYFADIRFGLVLYSTPPVTFYRVVRYIKKRDHSQTYLLLKDIFPQNALDIGILGKRGVKGLLYRYFRSKEKRLYEISDTIGCMSLANKAYILEHNPDVDRKKVEICPNCVEVADRSIDRKEREEIRKKYRIAKDAKVFVYGGNLGKPQGIGFMLKCLHGWRNHNKVFFLIIGNGTEYDRIKRYIEKYQPANILLEQWMPQADYEKVLAACDVGMIFLDHRFTIPNFPSRLSGYMSAKLPVLAVTDTATDIGKIIVENDFGWWCESNDIRGFQGAVRKAVSCGEEKGANGFQYLCGNYTVELSYEKIINAGK